MPLKLLQKFMNSLLGQFIIGGTTVASIAYLSNHLDDIALASVVAAVPIGMPASIFVHDSRVLNYSRHLVVSSVFLLIATAQNWYLLTYNKMGKYESVSYSMLTFAVLGIIYAGIA